MIPELAKAAKRGKTARRMGALEHISAHSNQRRFFRTQKRSFRQHVAFVADAREGRRGNFQSAWEIIFNGQRQRM